MLIIISFSQYSVTHVHIHVYFGTLKCCSFAEVGILISQGVPCRAGLPLLCSFALCKKVSMLVVFPRPVSIRFTCRGFCKALNFLYPFLALKLEPCTFEIPTPGLSVVFYLYSYTLSFGSFWVYINYLVICVLYCGNELFIGNVCQINKATIGGRITKLYTYPYCLFCNLENQYGVSLILFDWHSIIY